jgi:drug/metabolite transporter (DMT)-like permease
VRRSDAIRLVALSAIWGSSFIFIRVVAPVLGPVLTVLTRVLIGGAVLVAYCRIIGLDAQVKRHWRLYAVIGLVNSTLPFMLFAFAALHLPASYSVILNSTAPLFTALWAVPLLDERLTRRKLMGLVAGAAGVALVSRAGPVVPDLWFWIAVLACLGSTTCYALSSIYMKKRAAHLKPLAIAGWSQIFAASLRCRLCRSRSPARRSRR